MARLNESASLHKHIHVCGKRIGLRAGKPAPLASKADFAKAPPQRQSTQLPTTHVGGSSDHVCLSSSQRIAGNHPA